MSVGGKLFLWSIERVFPVALLGSLGVAALATVSDTAPWTRPASRPTGPMDQPARRVGVMFSMLRGLALAVATVWTVQGVLAILAAIVLLGEMFGEGRLVLGLEAVVVGLLGVAALLLGRRLARWYPRRGHEGGGSGLRPRE